MKKFLTFGLLLSALFFAGCSDGGEEQKNFLTGDEVLPQAKPPAPVLNPEVTGGVEFENLKSLNYKMFGAGGKGETDDFAAIVKTHEVANLFNKPVVVNDGLYYIGGADLQAVIQTNTDWTGAKFIIDDSAPVNIIKNVFRLASRLSPQEISYSKTIKRGDKKLDLQLEHPSFIIVVNDYELVYRRKGGDGENNGIPLTDMLVVDRDGNVREDTPVIFDFKTVTSMKAYPIDEDTLTVTGGEFDTWGFNGPYYGYFRRGLYLNRSNTVVTNLVQTKTKEYGSQAPAYWGFLQMDTCTDVLVRNVSIARHNNSGIVGTYGAIVSMASNAYFQHCRQDRGGGWGIFGSNNTKNITYDDVSWTRFDAHRGVYNVDIINSDLLGGIPGDPVRALGEGTLRVQNTTVNGSTVVQFREDYGCSWRGDIVIKDVKFSGGNVFGISVNANSDYGLPSYFAENIWMDGLEGNTESMNLSYANNNFVGEQDRPAGYKILPQKIYLRNVKGTVAGRNLAAQATILSKDADTGAVTVIQERNGNSTEWKEPPPYNNPAVKYLPISMKNGDIAYGYRADYKDWRKFPNPDPSVFPDWGK